MRDDDKEKEVCAMSACKYSSKHNDSDFPLNSSNFLTELSIGLLWQLLYSDHVNLILIYTR